MLWGLLLGNATWAHSSSNSYLTLSMPAEQLTLRADIHLRDLDLVFDLDENRDGQVTWAETQSRSAELMAWMAQGVMLNASGQSCPLGQADLKASLHADGTYLSALWTPTCLGVTQPLDQARLVLRYELIFSQDNLHRALLKVDFPNDQSSALLSPERPEIALNAAERHPLRVMGRYVVEGVWHIWIGIDHVVFLLSLLVLAPLQSSRQKVLDWQGATHIRPVALDVFAVVTAFTFAHSITLGLTVTGWLTPPADWVEPAIALSVVLAAFNNLLGVSSLKRWRLAFVFGLVHGFGFASVLLDLG
ncbi:MAG: HupE/UreJ family protein, partial [Burkholderiales bacterium]|nr:HupE/UreJ family protein [Burkholderiales bacterium]